MTYAQSWRGIAHSNDNHRRAISTGTGRTVALQITHRPIMALPPLSAWLSGAVVWAFVALVIVGVIVVSG